MNKKQLEKRRASAQSERDQFQPLLDEAFDYAIPYRRRADHDMGSGSSSSKGAKRVDKIFDQTAVTAAFRFAATLQRDLWPPHSTNFDVEAGPLIVDEKQRKELKQELLSTVAIVEALFQTGDWDTAFLEMATDLAAGNGAMLILPGTPRKPIYFLSVSINEVLFEGNALGDVSGIFWSRKWTWRDILETWPKAKLSIEQKTEAKENPEKEILVHQDTIFDKKKDRWATYVWCKDGDNIWDTSESYTCPWITPRYLRVPGEVMGRGIIHLALPTIKTLNTAARLQLQAAAIAMLGIYTVVDDGVFNPDLSPLEPGQFWKVARNGGVLGPSINRFPDPRLDLSNLVLGDLRGSIQQTMMDQNLPPESGGVRSATEIMQRVNARANDHIGAFGRLVKEIVIPAVSRVTEVAYQQQYISHKMPIDQLMLKIKISSPLGIAREMQKVETIVNWLTMVMQMAPDAYQKIAHRVESLIMAGEAMGVPDKLMVTDEERAAIEEQEQQQQAMAMAAEVAASAAETGPQQEGAPQ